MNGSRTMQDITAEKVFENCNGYAGAGSGARFTSLAVKSGMVIGLGSESDIAHLIGPETNRIDLTGDTVVPGLIDAHNHLIHYGVELIRSADLSGSRSIAEMLDRLRSFRDKHSDNTWLLGHRFDQELFAEGRWPTRNDLDTISKEIPIVISRVCLHAIVANSAALELVKGQISSEQLATGILIEDSADLMWQQIPNPSPSELKQAIQLAMKEARCKGLTGIHCMITSKDELDLLLSLGKEDLPVRITICCPYTMSDYLIEQGLTTGSGSETLRIGPLKIFMDGSLGARTAALKAPYTDDPQSMGILFRNAEELTELLRDLQPKGFQVAIHAIGDLAVECAVKGIEGALPLGNYTNHLRHRIEHASVLSEDLIRNMARLKIIAVVQPQFIITDFWTRERVGPERYRWCYPFRSLLNGGVILAMGSDCPVERLDAIELIHRAVTREPHSTGERLSAEQTITAYSYGSAYAGHQETCNGTLEFGKLADFTVLSQDIFAVEPEAISETQIKCTTVGGSLYEIV
ncbi:MAG: amidohydrolase [Armatimonadota bacterium]